MAMKILLGLILMFTLLSTVSFAEQEYQAIGGTGDDYRQGDGGFNSIAVTSTVTRSITDGEHVPLVADLDNDGTNEIIVLDGSTLRVFRDTDLQAISSESLRETGCKYAPISLFDIDEDGFIEIIVAPETCGLKNLSYYQFVNDTFMFERTFEFESAISAQVGGAEHTIKCGQQTGEEPRCVLISIFGLVDTSHFVRAQAFNATTNNTAHTFEQGGTVGQDAFCLPRVTSVAFSDYDNDNEKEFAFSWIHSDPSDDDVVTVQYFEVNSNLTVIEDGEFQITTNPIDFGTGNCAATGSTTGVTAGDAFTSPVVGEFFGGGGGEETAIAVMFDDNEFNLYLFDDANNQIAVHPENPIPFVTAEADGRILGNVMAMNVFSDTGEFQDYCVYAVEDVTDDISLLCGSLATQRDKLGLITDDDTVEFLFDKTGLFNISNTYDDFTNIAHASNMEDSDVDTGVALTDTTEIVTPHGVFQMTDIEDTDFFDHSKFDLNRIFVLSSDRACIVVDYEKNNHSDIICRGDTSLTYIDDGLIDGVAGISSYDINPCLDQGIIGLNTSIQFDVTVVDQNVHPLEQGLVNARVSIYVGSPNFQINTLGNQTSGTVLPFLFEFPPEGINDTGQVNFLIEAWDDVHPETIATDSGVFVVGRAGLQFGDCSQTVVIDLDPDDLTPAEILAAALPTDQADNGLTTALVTLGALSGLGAITIWFIAMIAVTMGVWFGAQGMNMSGSSILGIIAILNVLMIFLGAQIGVFGTGLVIILSVIGVVILGVFLGKFVTGVSSEGT